MKNREKLKKILKERMNFVLGMITMLILLGIVGYVVSTTYISGKTGQEYINTTNFHGIYDWNTSSPLYLTFNGTMLYFNDTKLNATTTNQSLFWDDLDDSSDITTLGTIVTGIWEGTAIVDEFLSSLNVTKLLDVFLLADTHTHDYTNITNEPWIEDSQESDLNVNSSNSSDHWNGFDSPIDLANRTNLYCGNITGADFDLCVNPDTNISDTNETTRIGNIVGTACSTGDYIYNFSVDGTPQCGTPAGGGDILGVFTQGLFLMNGSDTGSVYLEFNTTYADIYYYTQTDADSTFLGIADQRFNETTVVQAINTTMQAVNTSANINSLFTDDLTTDDDTHAATGGIYLYNDSTTHYFNDTMMNLTTSVISAYYETNCSVGGSCALITYDSELTYTTDTNASACSDGEYLDGSGICVNFNSTVDARVIGADTNCSVDMTCSAILYDTEIINATSNKSFYWDDLNVIGDTENLTRLYCGNITGADSNLCDIVDTNISDTDTQWGFQVPFLMNISSILSFNTTKMNETIDARISGSDTNCSVDGSCGLITYDSELTYTVDTNASNCGDGEYLDGSGLCVNFNDTVDDRDTDTNTQMTTDGLYLYNDTTTHYLNDTFLNLTIDTRITGADTNASNCGDGEYLDGSGLCVNFNATVDARDTNTNIIDDSLFNTTKLEEQPDGKLGIIDTFIDSLIDNRVTQAFISALSFFTKAETITNFVNRTNWTTIDNYPPACGAGEYASQIGDTLTCSIPTDTNCSGTLCGNLSVNKSNYWDDLDSPIDLQNMTKIYCGNITNATSDLCTIRDTNISDTDTQWGFKVPFLMNMSSVLTFNTTKMNETIDARVTGADSNASNCGDGEYLDGSGLCVNFNSTVDDRDDDSNASTICAGTTTYLDGEGNCDDISGVYLGINDDTNASSICAGTTTYLDGEGNCDDISGVYVDIAGDTMTGDLDMGGKSIGNVENITVISNITIGNLLIWDNGSHSFMYRT